MRSTITNREFDAEIVRVAEVADRARDLALHKAERVKRFLGATALRETARLRARDGADASAVIARASNTLAQSRTITRLREDLHILSLNRRVNRDTIVLGKVVAAAGRPAKGARVVVTTDTGREIGDAVVDEAGGFILDVPREKFDKLVEGARTLLVVVQDPGDRELARRFVPVRKRGSVVLTIDVSARRPTPSPEPAPPVVGLSDISGLGPARIARLNEAGINTAADLIRTPADDLARLLRVSEAQAGALVEEAKRLVVER